MKTQSQISQSRIIQEISSDYNPLRFLTPQRLCSALDAFQRGELAPAARIFEAISRRDDITRSVVAKRHGAIAKLDWDIVAKEGADEEVAKRHSEVLREFYSSLEVSHAIDLDKRGCVPMLVRQMMTAVDNKYSVHEIIWKPSTSGLRAEVRFVPLWFFENKTGRIQFLETSGTSDGIPMERENWLVCVAEVALMEATSIVYYAKNCGWKNWLVFSERYGFPFVHGKTGAQANSPEWNQFYVTLQNCRNGFAMLSDKDSEVSFLEATGAGAPFERIVARADRAIAALWRGADLSTLSNANGTGASMQGDETSVLEEDDAQMVEETIEHNLSERVLQYYFGDDVQPAAKFVLHRTDKTNTKEYLDVVERAARLGVFAPKNEVRQACKIPEAEDGVEVVEVQSAIPQSVPIANEKPSDSMESQLADLAKARGKDIEPLLAEFARLEKITDVEEYATALVELEAKIFKLSNGGINEAETTLKIIKENLTNVQK